MLRPGNLRVGPYSGLGYAYTPPPPPKLTASGTLDCGPNKPASTATAYYYCCPGGWTRVAYGDTNPCRGQVMPGSQEEVRQQLLQQQIAAPIITGPALEIPQEQPIVDPSKMPLVIGGVVMLFVVTLAAKMIL